MKLITKVLVTEPFPIELRGQLVVMEKGDALTIQSPQERGADIPPATAKSLLLQRMVRVPGRTQGDDE